jgi:hypothetical protein
MHLWAVELLPELSPASQRDSAATTPSGCFKIPLACHAHDEKAQLGWPFLRFAWLAVMNESIEFSGDYPIISAL